MVKKRLNLYNSFLIFFVCIIICISYFPSILAVNIDHISGYDKGPSYRPVVPLKKTTLVNFDQETYLDDYAYLAAVPTAVFYSEDNLFSHPLLFYQDEYPIEDDTERSLNARQGLDYFMEDWMSYNNGVLDKMTLINVPMSNLDGNWKSMNQDVIESDSPYEIAAQLALNEWSYSNSAVIAVIDEKFEKSEYRVSAKMSGKLDQNDILEENFEVKQTNQLDPIYNEFSVPEGYKYLKARVWYPCIYATLGFGSFQGIANISIPSGDKDLQLYCKYNDDWMQTAAVSEWNQKFGMDIDIDLSYVYQNGPWRVGITDIPTKKIGRYGSLREVFRNMFWGVVYQVDIEMFPGTIIQIPEKPPFGCRDVTFKLTWENSNVDLGFSLIGPGGEEVVSSMNGSDYQEMHLDQLGECLDEDNYSICVFALDNVHTPIDFTIQYSWGQEITKEEGNALASATEGAVLASVLNTPLLYTSTSHLPAVVKDVLYTLGTKNVYVVDIGHGIELEALTEIDSIVKVHHHYTILKDIYDTIKSITGNNDVVFSTLDPWSHWYVTEMKPGGESPGALHIGPAAYLAAHHGTSVLIIDCHPELSTAIVWHNEYWKRTSHDPVGNDPSVAEMYLTGTRVYNFLRKFGFDQVGRETIISVGGQYDIAPSWDRMFAGMAKSGKFLYSPVDVSYWISRNVFYPALIFINPAMNPNGVELMTGGENKRKTILSRSPLGLTYTTKPGTEHFKYPVHLTFSSYTHRFNERASKYYGFKYQSADDIVPGETRSMEPIDQGLIEKYTGNPGAFWPDLSSSDIVPVYMEKGGYGVAMCSNFPDTMDNLNEGVLYWYLASHGGHMDSGLLLFWDPTSEGKNRGCFGIPLPPGSAAKKDLNPWRSYDWYLGSTEEPDTISAEIHGIIPAIIGNPNINGLARTAFDWAPAKKPFRDVINNLLARIPVVNKLLSEGRLETQDYYDGQICGALVSTLGYTWYSGYAIDDALENIHSMVFLTGVCLTATKYAHLTMVRHGSVAQIIDPWPTSWYGTMWMQSIPRDIILGDTLGEAYNKGISHVGILYIGDNDGPPQWWWDSAENVCLFGDPNLRMFVPDQQYSDDNFWTKEEVEPLRYDADLDIDGHMPFGITGYPKKNVPQLLRFEYIIAIIVLVVVALTLTAYLFIRKKKK
jgi:hypothetical protein